jgi:hypothetical protein
MEKSVRIAVCLLAVGPALCQMPYRNEADLSDLFARVSASDYVVIAKLSKSAYIPPRPSKEKLDRLRLDEETATKAGGGVINPPNDMTKSGMLYTLTVTASVCRQADFRLDPEEQASLRSPVYMLIPWREGGSDADVERFDPGATYLLFIEKDQAQDKFGALYQLDTTRTYYRAHLRSRGVLQLPSADNKGGPGDKVTPVVSAVTTLCDAVKPADYIGKIGSLTGLMYSSSDPNVRQAAEDAITVLKAARAKQQ